MGPALRAGTLDHVEEAVDRILTRPTLARFMQEACKFPGRPNAAVDIAGEVLRETAFAETSDGEEAIQHVRGDGP